MSSCASCGADIPGGFAFCGRCGARLTPVPADLAEERKVVSVLFCDLVGFTARSDQADPEEIQARLAPYHRSVQDEVQRYGGTVEKFIGDAVVGAFGVPSVHEDDPERAVRAALAVVEAIQELNQTRPGMDLAVRVAVTTGEAMVALGARPERGEHFLTGDVANTASRLQGMAPVGGVVVGEATWRATRDQFVYQRLEPVRVKGKANPLPIWQVITARSRHGVDVDHRPMTPFVGRELELALLQGVYGRAVQEASIQLVTILGEPGIGKTRLVREFGEFVDAQPELVAWRQGRCLPYGEGITFWALGEVLKAQAGILESDDPTQAASKLAGAVAAVVQEPAEQEWLKARLAPFLGLAGGEGGQPEQEEAFAAWRRFLEAIAAKDPLVMVLEDLHWADPALLAFVTHLVEWASGVPLVVIATARPELYERATGWGGGVRNVTTISLGPLSDADTARLVAAALGPAVLSPQTQAVLLQRAEGNPLYAEQVCRMLNERSQHDNQNGTGPGDGVGLPESIQALIAARLDTLAPQQKSLLQDAAVVGTVFWAGALSAMGDRDAAMVEAGLHELARRDFIRPARNSSIEGEAEYAFWHVLTRDVAYSGLPRMARVSKHQAAAAWIQRSAGERVADHAEVLAYHYETALGLARAAGATSQMAAVLTFACRFLVLAGDRAMALNVTRAYAFYRQALALLPLEDVDHARLLAKAAEAAHHAGQLAEAEQLYQQAIAAFRAQGNLLGAGTAEVRRSNLLWWWGETARAREARAAAIRLLEAEPPGVALAQAYAEMAREVMLAGRPPLAVEWANKAITLASRVDAEEARQYALQMRGVARCDLGDFQGLDDLREALEIGLQQGMGRLSALAYSNLAGMLLLVEGPQAALPSCRNGLDVCRQRGIEDIASGLRFEMTECLFDLGEWDQLVGIADEVLSWSGRQGGSYVNVRVQAAKARVLVWRGELAAAAALAADALPHARQIGEPQILASVLPVAALVEQARGDLIAAVRLVSELDQAIHDGPGTHRAWALPDLVRICVTASRPTLAQRLLEGLEVYAARLQHCLTTARAHLAEAHGDLDTAAGRYTEAATCWSRFGCVPEHAHALFGLGRSLARAGRPGSQAHLQAARGIFASLGARSLAAETDGWLQRTATQSS